VHSVEFQNVSKSYPIYASPGDRLKELLTANRKSWHQDFWALRDVTFSIATGETFCVIGENGAGKSTLLQLVAGILSPSDGSVKVNGKVSALLELGAGFNPEFTGRDNVYMNAAILGLSRAEIDRRYRLIEEFAEIGEFINQPVKTYSSGMAVRLAFAVAIHVDPEILLVDEALAVGDIYFRQRCLRKVHELRTRGTTILFVSHAISDVKAIGDRTLWLDQGRVRELGETDIVAAKYMAAMSEKDSLYITARKPAAITRSAASVHAPEIVDRIPNIDHRHGDQRAEVLGIAVLDSQGRPIPVLQPLSTIVVRISVRANQGISAPIVGYMIRNHLGIDFSGTNTSRLGSQMPPMAAGDIFTVDFHVQLPELYPGSFSFSPAVADGSLSTYCMCDWIDNAVTLPMAHSSESVYGFLHFPSWVEFNSRLWKADSPKERSHA
jgi:ABC-type polysaccharide/polyol phosphate transport system ATPase subunit